MQSAEKLISEIKKLIDAAERKPSFADLVAVKIMGWVIKDGIITTHTGAHIKNWYPADCWGNMGVVIDRLLELGLTVRIEPGRVQIIGEHERHVGESVTTFTAFTLALAMLMGTNGH